ncbi:MMPL family transporter [Sulfurovum sp. XGS-02]|uniref:efflux RND transporter permease subunit n=1 Tax=Sulfurovum sp. XGS-02 TaxID=2925411 RepID=UPI002063A0ED|nr:MMPL family transporter [Sulfurovum sp. XGS-02]UPT76931.1 MMPL family transporter [Sulfurovum sp. XGS-02]
MLYTLYQKLILKYPFWVLTILISSILIFGINIQKLEIDASAETLLLNDDKDLAFSRTVAKRFQTNDLLILAYKPKQDLLSPESLQTLTRITNDLEQLPRVESVDSLINVPLFFSPIREMDDLINETRTLKSDDINLSMVKHEFLTSPLYKDSLVNKDFTISSIIIHLYQDPEYFTLLEERNRLLDKQKASLLTKEEKQELHDVSIAFKAHRDAQRDIDNQNITAIRALISKYQDDATFFLGGVQMISNDIVGFIKNDLLIYGSTLILLIILVLGFIFKKIRWVMLPILICALSVIAITSSLGYFGWEITVISSNFIALQLIITISIVLHLIVRYEELLTRYPRASSKRLILYTVLTKATPTTFAILTTIAGFSSLLYSHIYPVINLGWMMSAGITMSLVIAFIILPAVLMLLKKTPPVKQKRSMAFIPSLTAKIVLHDKKAIYIVTLLSIVFSITGASQLIVENSFINYFKKDTEIYKGMSIIDQELGGTTPLDVILTLSDKNSTPTSTASTQEETFDETDSFEEEFSSVEDQDQYWFTEEKIQIIKNVHHYLTDLAQVGEVQSFATLLATGKILNKNKNLDSIDLALIYKKLPQKYRDVILTPYVNIEHDQLRFSTRVIDSNEVLRRDALLKKVKDDLTQLIDPNVATVQLSNLMVLYNNMLQSLFHSQITMIGLVLLIVSLMFLILFRSLKLTLIALTVNVIPIALVFGFMGWLHIPLDIMTITIAAIAMGIGIDDTIHYIHRFKVEFEKDNRYYFSMHRTSTSIGNALYFTTLVIVIGFSILTLSNLIPTIYFGLLTMVVMIAALTSDMILLPKLLIVFKPFKRVK